MTTNLDDDDGREDDNRSSRNIVFRYYNYSRYDDRRSNDRYARESLPQVVGDGFSVHCADGPVASTAGTTASTRTRLPEDLSESVRRLEEDGFVVFPRFFDDDAVRSLKDRLEHVLRGRYDRGVRPDKAPRRLRSEPPSSDGGGGVGVRPLGFSGNLRGVKVLQVINAHKCDSIFRALATHPALGELVGRLRPRWPGARLAQDQVWAKPPGAPPLVYHRDAPYFMFDPPDVVTVWVALDDMDDERIGPLRYVRGSHEWGDGRVGSSRDFFQHDGGRDLLRSAYERRENRGNNHDDDDADVIEIVSLAGLVGAGGLSVHDGRTWHGSSKNESTWRPRRGVGIHFVPSNVRWTADAGKSQLWKSYVDDVDDASTLELSNEDFPITWTREVAADRD